MYRHVYIIKLRVLYTQFMEVVGMAVIKISTTVIPFYITEWSFKWERHVFTVRAK